MPDELNPTPPAEMPVETEPVKEKIVYEIELETPVGDERLTAYKIKTKGMMLGQSGIPLLDYAYIAKVMQTKFKTYKKLKTQTSPNAGAHTILKSELEQFNKDILTNKAIYDAEIQAIKDNFNKYAKP